jgi:uncharacterized protein
MPSIHSRLIVSALLLAIFVSLLAPGLGGALPALAAGTVSLTALGAAYTQDFNTLASSGIANTAVPLGWEFSESGTNGNTTYRAGTGSDNAGDTYSFGATGNSDRAFGGLRSNSLVPLIGAQFANNTGGTITSLAISYTGEQWRLGQNTTGRAADRLDFQVSTDAASITTGTWTDIDALDFASPVVAGTVGALDGNAPANRTALSFTISGLEIANGASFWLRWADTDLPGSDDGLAVDDFTLIPNGNLPIIDSAPEVSLTSPASGATNVPSNGNLVVTFNEPVNVSANWFTLACNATAKAATFSGGPSSFTIDPSEDFPFDATCTLTILATEVTDQDTNDPPDNLAANLDVSFAVESDPCLQSYTPAYAIQGAGAVVAITGPVTTQGIVVGDYEYPGSGSTNGFLRGFYVQDASGDGNPATSDAIFVFNGNNNSVNLGDLVRVTGTAGEFQDQSQISATAVRKCGTGSVAPVDITFPVASPTALEQYEGMLVRLPQTLYVSEHFQLGRFGQVVLAAGGRLKQPTNVVAPGALALALQAQNNLHKIILDDASQAQNPDPILFGRGGQPLSASNTLRGGDSATGIVGVLSYTWAGNSASGNAYRVRPIGSLGGFVNFEASNPRPVSVPARTGGVRVAGMNLLNFFNTFDGLPDTVDNCTNGAGGAPADCRGADTQAEFDRQWPKTVAAILGTGADIVGVIEIENDGYGPESALQFLVDRLNAATAPGTYALVDVDARTGQVNALGLDAIKVGLIYKPGVVTLVGQTAALNSAEFVNGGDSAPRNRAALAQAFEANATGGRFVVSVNHLKSKGSACDAPDAGDGQGNCNIVRTNAANLLAAWLAGDPTGSGDPDVLILGDLNAYAMEDPITAIKNAGYTNLIHAFGGDDAYSYVFDGQWGYLDHALSNSSLSPQVTGVAEWHINADEPSVLDYNTDFKTANLQTTLYAPDEFRISDHDPVLVDMNLTNAPPVVGPITAPAAPVGVNTAFAVSAPFADPETYDTHTALWNWGDGSTTAGIVNESNGAGTVSGSHTYATPGVYTVVLTVTDDNGNSATATYEHVVAYDVNGGFVIGGGWISSPAGAWLPNPAAKGKAVFGFVSKYKKNALVPNGETLFLFSAGRMNFKSSGYAWLVVNGAKAQYTGAGRINGAGDYGFTLTAVDGKLPGGDGKDKLRMQIWDRNNGNAIVYDNQLGLGNDATPTTVLGGGAIAILPGRYGHVGASGEDVDAMELMPDITPYLSPEEASEEAAELPAPDWVNQANRIFLPTLTRE